MCSNKLKKSIEMDIAFIRQSHLHDSPTINLLGVILHSIAAQYSTQILAFHATEYQWHHLLNGFRKYPHKEVCGLFKVTRHLCFKNSKNLHPLDILACNSANKPSFQNPAKSPFAQCSIDIKRAVTGLRISNLTSANRCYFENITALFTSMQHWAKGPFDGNWKDGLLAESQARTHNFAIFEA